MCPIYGFGMVIVLYALTPLADNTLLLYLGGVILPSALELVGGWALYKLYRTRWWDYSDYPFNIGGYICLEFCLLWGVGTLVVMRIVHPIIAGWWPCPHPGGRDPDVHPLRRVCHGRGGHRHCGLHPGRHTGHHGEAGRQHPMP